LPVTPAVRSSFKFLATSEKHLHLRQYMVEIVK